MSKVIVTTTINAPAEALRKFAAMPDWQLVVIGDKKTPPDFHIDGAIYVSPEEQKKYDRDLSEALGWNVVERRNYGFLWARDMDPEVVAVVDDDNVPLENWGEQIFVGKEVEVDYYETDLVAFDPVAVTEHSHLWHRGYPPQLLAERDFGKPNRKVVTPDVQADFWNGDPDIDAFCRMQFKPDVVFDAVRFPLASNKMGPFNSENTFVSPDWLGEYFLFPHVGRFIDIWTAYYVQAHGPRSSTAHPPYDRTGTCTTSRVTSPRSSSDTSTHLNCSVAWPRTRWPSSISCPSGRRSRTGRIASTSSRSGVD